MPRCLTDEAIVLRTHNVGETDRFCILLTKENGKVAARARGVRRLTSRRSGGLLPMHRVSITLEEHSFGYAVAAAACIDANSAAWKNPQAFGRAARGIELLLLLTEEGVELSDVYDLTVDFLSSCTVDTHAYLVPLFTCKLLSLLGLFPSVTHSAFGEKLTGPLLTFFNAEKGAFTSAVKFGHEGIAISERTLALLRTLDDIALTSLPTPDAIVAYDLERITQGLLGSQLGASLSSPPVSLALSSSVTPICQ